MISAVVNELEGTYAPEKSASYVRHLIDVVADPKVNLAEAFSGTIPGARGPLAAGVGLLLYVWPESFGDNELSRQAQSIFDICFGPIYKAASIDARSQAFEKRQTIRETWEATRADFRRLYEANLGLDSLRNFRQRYLQLFNSERARLLIRPLLHPILQDVLVINAALNQLEHYVAAEGAEKRQAAQYASEAVANLRPFLEQAPTILREMFASPLEGMFLTFSRSWEQDPANLQASIVIEPKAYRYALDQKGQHIGIGLKLLNEGPGIAWDVTIEYLTELAFSDRQLYIGTIEPGSVTVDLPEDVLEPAPVASVTCRARWTDSAGPRELQSTFGIECQRRDVDWNMLSSRSPYSTEPVFKEDQFFGRHDTLDLLTRQLSQEQMPSFYVVGQKRVGKTSLVKRIAEIMRDRAGPKTSVIFVSPEHYIADTAADTVHRLTQYIGRELIRIHPQLRQLDASPLRELRDLASMLETIRASSNRVVIAVDEFDEIPPALYEEKSDLSRPFFLALRGLSSQSHISFVIIGSEKLDLIMREQGQRLNKWSAIKLDYFSKDTSWNDYRDLIVRPVENQVDYGDEAINRLYEITAGHPYFTKQVCQRVLDDACRTRLSWVSEQSVNQATQQLIEQLDSGAFQHFWKDGQVGSYEQQERQRFLRQSLLLAMADLSRNHKALSYESVLAHPSVANIAASARVELSQFFTRRILKGDQSAFDFRVDFFRRWLEHKGTEQVASSIPDTSPIIEQLKANSDLAIKSSELVAVSRDWVYKGHLVSTDEIRLWLEQFGGPEEQRLAYRILGGLTFVTAEYYRREFARLASEIQRRLPAIIASKTRKRRDMIVSYLGSPGKSGAGLARKFADAAKILTDRIVDFGRLETELVSGDPVSALIFVDDFIGTGNSVCSGIEDFWKTCGKTIENDGTFVFFLPVIAMDKGRDRLMEVARRIYPGRFEVHAVSIFGEEKRLFSPASETFPENVDRECARELIAKFGRTLEPRHPVGYEDGQLALVFESTCPNNSLPVLWKTKGSWKALFQRHGDG